MFDDPMFEGQAKRALGYAEYGGAELGECFATAQRITNGDTESWYREWLATADRVFGIAEDCAAKGHRVSAREAYLRASNYYRTAYLFLYGAPVDPRLIAAFDRETAAFLKAAKFFDPPIEPVEIPFEGVRLPGYFYHDGSGRPRPTVICTNGYDSTINEMHFGHAVAAVRRGYNVLLFDGPGQGRPLYKQGLVMRPDWENVVRPVMDYALARPEVDAKRVALIGWSFGGYLAPRAASGEPRLAALIADPGQWDLMQAMKDQLPLPQAVRDRLPNVTAQDLQPLQDLIDKNLSLRWAFKQRGEWVHGVDSLLGYIQAMDDYRLSTVARKIACPSFISAAESDPVSKYAAMLYAALNCPKTLVHFTNAEGAGDHCEIMARGLFHQRSFDWLDEVMR
jgi:pimeloyl-ACP methyl ester carboxylesterase